MFGTRTRQALGRAAWIGTGLLAAEYAGQQAALRLPPTTATQFGIPLAVGLFGTWLARRGVVSSNIGTGIAVNGMVHILTNVFERMGITVDSQFGGY